MDVNSNCGEIVCAQVPTLVPGDGGMFTITIPTKVNLQLAFHECMHNNDP